MVQAHEKWSVDVFNGRTYFQTYTSLMPLGVYRFFSLATKFIF